MLFADSKEKFLTGNEAVFEAALYAGAKIMCGYPITPATEILENWAKNSSKPNAKTILVQSEDETSAGFNVIGAILSGTKAFTATAGIGNVLLQDPLSMAEAMRFPFVAIIMQRGGPSTGTVIYSQQEVNLSCYGGNGESLRIVYSTSGPQELYDYTIKAFNTAWTYWFPVIVLGDGYQSKMKAKVKLNRPHVVKAKPILTPGKITNIRNCYNFENELAKELKKNIEDWNKISRKITEFEEYQCSDAEIIIFAHGIVGASAKKAVDILRKKYNKKVGLFRPITLRPFPKDSASRLAAKASRVLITESSEGQFSRIVKDNLYGLTKISYLFKPVVEINSEEIIEKISSFHNDFWLEH